MRQSDYKLSGCVRNLSGIKMWAEAVQSFMVASVTAAVAVRSSNGATGTTTGGMDAGGAAS